MTKTISKGKASTYPHGVIRYANVFQDLEEYEGIV